MKKLIFTALALCCVVGAMAETKTNYEVRYASNPTDFKTYDTERIRQDYLVQNIFVANEVNMTYTMHDRMIIGGAMPVGEVLKLETIDPLKAEYFLARREIGIFNVGGDGVISVDGKKYKMGYKECIYIGQGVKEVTFASNKADAPALFYFNSTPAHTSYPTKKITREDAKVLKLGSLAESNDREVIQFIVNQTTQTCQLQLGMTELKTGSVWNTMPTHFHDRRMEAYFYFELPESQAVYHFVGQPQETRGIWMQNYEATISPEWSIHGAAGTTNYTFIWGMGGENLDYGDVDKVAVPELR